jgi:hypothetical protein
MSIKLACLLAIAWFTGLGIAPVVLATESADRAAIEAAAQAWTRAFNARDANALLAVASDDLVLLDGSSAPMSGPRARDAWKKALGSAQGQRCGETRTIAGNLEACARRVEDPSSDVVPTAQPIQSFAHAAGAGARSTCELALNFGGRFLASLQQTRIADFSGQLSKLRRGPLPLESVDVAE